MKLRISTIISLVGVLGAGSAAALVNTQVLQNAETNSNGDVSIAGPSGTEVTGTSVAGDEVTKLNAEVTKINSSVLTSTQAMYQIGDAGVVTLETAGDVLTVVSATPNAGWTVVSAESNGASNIEVKLLSGTTLVEFKASLLNGVITTSVESKFVGTTPGSGSAPGSGSTPGSGSIDDDDDEDDDDHDTVGDTIENHDDDDDDSGHGGDDD